MGSACALTFSSTGPSPSPVKCFVMQFIAFLSTDDGRPRRHADGREHETNGSRQLSFGPALFTDPDPVGQGSGQAPAPCFARERVCFYIIMFYRDFVDGISRFFPVSIALFPPPASGSRSSGPPVRPYAFDRACRGNSACHRDPCRRSIPAACFPMKKSRVAQIRTGGRAREPVRIDVCL